ncbi:MAG: hypothetical protein ABW352_14715 [Polyangiales bacterium]
MPLRVEPCSPRELFAQLFLEPEESAHFLRPALRFARQQLAQVVPPNVSSPEAWIEQAIDEVGRAPIAGHAFSWVARVVRELAPVGLNDGAWLSTAARLPSPELALEQLALRCGVADASHDAYATRYAGMLRSLGIAPDATARFEFDESPQCAELSFERALLGPCMARFPELFGCELLGFNLWMAALGPAPLLWQLRDELALREASLRYLERHDRPRLRELAKAGALLAIRDGESAERVARGFFAAHQGYLRWERGMLRGNVPFTPREFVLEGVVRKARFAAEHHRDIELKGQNLETMFLEGGSQYDRILDHMAATASLIRPGAPDRSPFMTHALSLDGPMFDAFTPAEKGDLREWIALLPESNLPRAVQPEPLTGDYLPPHDAEALLEHARATFAWLDEAALAERLDDPLLPLFAPEWVAARLQEEEAPGFSLEALSALASREAERDARWLVGFADVARMEFDEYRSMLRAHVAGSASVPALLPRMMALRTRLFMPELLGLWLGPDEASQAAADAYLARVETGAPFDLASSWQRMWSAARLSLRA